jgi:hypothetical protein
MSRTRRLAALALGATLILGRGIVASAQDITIRVPAIADSISPAPEIVVQGTPLPIALQPSIVQLEFFTDPSLAGAPFLVRNATGASASFLVPQLLPERTRVFLRARVIDAAGVVRQQTVAMFTVRSWLRLVDPIAATNNVLFTRQPRFVWSSPAITLPPGPWEYQLFIVNTRTGNVDQQPRAISDTSFVPTTPLEACTSYSWRVQARAISGTPTDQVIVSSPGTFVIQTAECPSATIFYQNFPNPFGRGTLGDRTCFWFDLLRRATVRLTVYDLQLHEVRRVIPPAQMDSGAYGRQNSANQSGCDNRFSWDGRDNNGRQVPAGVYIAVFIADGVRSTKKILYKGP